VPGEPREPTAAIQNEPPQIWWTLRIGEFDLASRSVSLGIILGHCASTHTTHSCVASARRGTGGLTTQQRASQPYDFANLKPNNKFQESNSQNRARYFFKDVFLERQLPRLSLELARALIGIRFASVAGSLTRTSGIRAEFPIQEYS
jgi:hypothetical protein